MNPIASRVYEIASKTMVAANDSRIDEVKNLPKEDRYIMASADVVDSKGVDIYEADVVLYKDEYYGVQKIGNEVFLYSGDSKRIAPDWSNVQVVGCIVDNGIA